MRVLRRPHAALLAGFVCALAILVGGDRADAGQAGCGAEQETIAGTVTALASSVRSDGNGAGEPPSVSLLIRTDDAFVGLVGITLTPDARVTAADGSSTAPEQIPLGSRIRACGRYLGPMEFEATSIELLS